MRRPHLEPRAWIGALSFMALLVAPLAGQLAGSPDDIAALENRAVAPAPTLADARADWAGFPGRINAWLEDRFGFRGELVRLYLWLNAEVDTGRPRDAVRGDDGWLFAAVNDAMAGHEGRRPFRPGEAEQWLDTLDAIRAQAEAAGARFFVLIAPDKQSVYPELLSRYPRRFDTEPRSDALVRLALEHGMHVVNARDALIAHKADGPLYSHTDSHWDDRGGYVAYRALIDDMRAEGVPVEPVGEDRLRSSFEDGFRGDLYILIGEPNGPPETLERLAVVDPAPVASYEELPQYRWGDFDSFRQAGPPRGRPRLLILGDSYSRQMLPFYAESFDELTFAHHRTGAIPPDVIEPGRYDVVVFEIVERVLNAPPHSPPTE